MGDKYSGDLSVISFVLQISLRQCMTNECQKLWCSVSKFVFPSNTIKAKYNLWVTKILVICQYVFVIQIPLWQNITCEWQKIWWSLGKIICASNTITGNMICGWHNFLSSLSKLFCGVFFTISAKMLSWSTNTNIFTIESLTVMIKITFTKF